MSATRETVTITKGQWYFSIIVTPVMSAAIGLLAFNFGLANRLTVVETELKLLLDGQIQIKKTVANPSNYEVQRNIATLASIQQENHEHTNRLLVDVNDNVGVAIRMLKNENNLRASH